jgi:acyl-CoA thioesterase I
MSSPRVGACCLVAAALAAPACDSCTAIVSPSGVSRPAPSLGRRIVVLGDSLAVSPSRDESFPAALQARLLQQRLPWTVMNGGINGDTTAGGLRRVDALIGDGEVRILVVALGANDGLRGVSVSLVEQNLSAIIERAHARQIKVLLCGMETPPLHGWDYTVAFHGVFLRLASRYALPRVPFLLDGVALVPSLNGDDGIHPNAAGARRIAETIWPYLEPLVAEETAIAIR